MTSPGWDHAEADPTFARRAVEFILSQKGSFRLFFLYLAVSAETVRLVRRQGAHSPRPAEHRQLPRGPR